jgi:hypothetical protein
MSVQPVPSVQSIQGSHAASDAEALSNAQATRKHASKATAIPQDRVTISQAAQAKQTVASIGPESDQAGK